MYNFFDILFFLHRFIITTTYTQPTRDPHTCKKAIPVKQLGVRNIAQSNFSDKSYVAICMTYYIAISITCNFLQMNAGLALLITAKNKVCIPHQLVYHITLHIALAIYTQCHQYNMFLAIMSVAIATKQLQYS